MKIEMKLTLTEQSTPRLVNFLGTFTGARDRAFVLRQLAERALEAGLAPIAPPSIATAPAAALPVRKREPTKAIAKATAPVAVRKGATARKRAAT